MTPEGIVKAEIKKILKEHGAYYTMPMTFGYGGSGAPDFIACVNGHFVGIEAKADTKKRGPTAIQRRTLQVIADAGGYGIVIDCHNYDELDSLLRKLTKRD